MSGTVKLNSAGGGSISLTPASTASNVTATVPAATDTLVNLNSTQTITNKTLTAAGSNTVEATSGPTSTQLAGQRNKIINGAMMIDQRNAGASTTVTANGYYSCDRWKTYSSPTSKYAVQQNAGAVTPPVGFSNYLGITSASAYTPSSGDYFWIEQSIEGFNIADLAWGTANAKTVVLSFQVYSSLTGQFGGSIANAGRARTYPFSYTVSSPNTWTSVSITIPGDTSGVWAKDNTAGLLVLFDLGSGSSLLGTAGSWNSSGNVGATGDTKVIATNGATFYITGVQLEKGATATPFENRLYGEELMLCQRYYRQTSKSNYGEGTIYGYMGAASNAIGQSYALPVQMRASPTTAYAGSWTVNNGTQFLYADANMCFPYVMASSSGIVSQYSLTNGYITFNAEL